MRDESISLTAEWLPVCNSEDVPEGSARGFIVADERIVVWRDSIGAAHVWRDYCPHRGAQLSLGHVMRSDRVSVSRLALRHRGTVFADSVESVVASFEARVRDDFRLRGEIRCRLDVLR
jgi:hypothetical protein